jgi:hypothetical protein
MAKVCLKPPNFSFGMIHPWTVRFNKGIWEKVILPNPFPFSEGTRLLSSIIGMDPKLWDAHLPNYFIHLVSAIRVGPLRLNRGPTFVIAKQLCTCISLNRLHLTKERVQVPFCMKMWKAELSLAGLKSPQKFFFRVEPHRPGCR